MVIDSRAFYGEYHGHLVEHLAEVHAVLRAHGSPGGRRRPLIWLAGDSSLDNKYWLPHGTAAATGGFEQVLAPPVARQDVCHCINEALVAQQSPFRCINAAVEATMLRQRSCGSLLAQDKFVRDHLEENDVVVVSVGGNDIALAPAPCTILHLLAGVCCTPNAAIRHAFGRPAPCDDCCCGCGPGCLSTFSACPPSGGYFLHMFHTKLQAFIRALVAKTRPSKVLACMIYYPDVGADGSWADTALKALRYNTDPSKLQLIIAQMFEKAIRKITVPGSQVVPVPLFEALDGKNTDDYVQRVEPSVQGGRKMAKLLLRKAFGTYDGHDDGLGGAQDARGPPLPPVAMQML